MLPSSLIARALSRLLSHDANARALLSPHAGETLQVRMPPLAAALKITAEGDFVSGEFEVRESTPTVSVEFPLSALPLIAQGETVALRAATISGQAGLLQDVSKAFKSLPLAAEAELERFVGPIFANEATKLFKALIAFGENAQSSLQEAGKRYVHNEAKLVAERDAVAQFAADIQRLRIDVERLRQRVAQI